MLAWWAAIPFLTACGFVIAYCRPAETQKVDMLPSYIVGGIIGTALISLLIGWIAYRIFRRSQLAGTLAFTLMLAFVCWSQWLTAQQRTSAAAILTALPSVPVALPMIGVSVYSPTGWVSRPTGSVSIAACWDRPAPGGGFLATLFVEGYVPASDDPLANVQALAKQMNGTIQSDHELLDGQRAWQIRADPTRNLSNPTCMLVTFRNGGMYLISLSSIPGFSYDRSLEEVRSSWKWTAIESPARHLVMQTTPRTIYDGKLTILCPDTMQPFRKQPDGAKFGLILPSFAGQDDFTAIIQLPDLAADDTLADIEKRLTVGMAGRRSEPYAWYPIKSRLEGGMTQMVKSTRDGDEMWEMLAVVRLSSEEFAMINFATYSKNTSDRAAYAKVAQQMAESLALKATVP